MIDFFFALGVAAWRRTGAVKIQRRPGLVMYNAGRSGTCLSGEGAVATRFKAECGYAEPSRTRPRGGTRRGQGNAIHIWDVSGTHRSCAIGNLSNATR